MPIISDGGDGGGGAGLMVATVTLTNAQILALVATPVTLVAAPGTGKVILGPASGIGYLAFHLNTTAAPYTNVDAGCEWQPFIGPSGAVAKFSGAFSLLTFNGDAYQVASTAGIVTATAPGADVLADLANQPLRLTLGNAALGNVTGGDAANACTAYVGYQVLTL